ncbi:MAG TPA: 2TM domain-containing protein [Saprospiraceae bacterium]|nr:2TM domain-containing protein [Saprospiraceae bacterium]
MYHELRKKAEKKVQAKMAFYICVIVFSFTTVILLMLSFYLPAISFWLRLPIMAFIMVLGVLYLTVFGWPAKRSLNHDWQEEEIEKEMRKLYQQKKTQLPPAQDLSEEERLELKELERLEKKWDGEEDYV